MDLKKCIKLGHTWKLVVESVRCLRFTDSQTRGSLELGMRYSRISNCNRQTDRRTEQTNIRTCRPGSLQLKINMTYQVNLTKVSPIKMESITMISEYLPVGIAKLNVNNVWIKGAALFLGIFQILHFQRVENRNIWKTVLKVKKLLNFI